MHGNSNKKKKMIRKWNKLNEKWTKTGEKWLIGKFSVPRSI